MPYQFPIDELTLINSALALTGDNAVAQSDDGSGEWNVCSPAYQRGLGYAMESHGWGFAATVAVLQPSPTLPADTAFDSAYPIPSDCAHIIWVKIQDADPTVTPPVTTPPYPVGFGQPSARPALYNILGTPTGPVIVMNAFAEWPGYPTVPPPTSIGRGIVTLKYIQNSGPLTESTSGTPTLMLALQSFVMSGIYSGLHEDPNEARSMWQAGEAMLQKARTRYDQGLPKRAFFNSRMSAARLVRRPWPPAGIDSWSGSRRPG